MVLASNGHLHTFDGTTWVDNGVGGSGSSARVDLTPPLRTFGQYTQNVVIPGLSASSNVFLTLVPNAIYDNDELGEIRLSVLAKSGSADVTVFLSGPIAGPITAAYTVI